MSKLDDQDSKRLQDAEILLALIADSEQALREGRWITQEQMEKLMREKFGI
jgi:hypothetical protein